MWYPLAKHKNSFKAEAFKKLTQIQCNILQEDQRDGGIQENGQFPLVEAGGWREAGLGVMRLCTIR